MRVGVNLLAWSATIDLGLFPRIVELGYDGVELPILTPEAIDAAAVRTALARAGLAATASSALPRGASLLDPAERSIGVAFLTGAIETATACGASVLCGPLYHPVGQLPGRPPTDAELESCAIGLRVVARRAADLGVTLALEPLNRFETHFLNTIGQGLRLIEAVGHPAVGLHVDTFHQNIEEKDVAVSWLAAGRWLKHVHFSENDRGVVGSGHIDFAAARDALRSLGYDGWVVAETFAGSVPEIAAATAIWRPIVADPWSYAAGSLRAAREILS